MISEKNKSKIVDFLCPNTLKFDFSDKMSFSKHSKRFKSEDEYCGERERKQDREFAGRLISHELISDPNHSSKIFGFFFVKMQ